MASAETSDNGNAVGYFLDRHLAEGRGERLAYIEADGQQRQMSYAALAAQSGRFAAVLARLGVRREERLAMIQLDSLAFPVAFWGALRAGVLPVPLNTLLSSAVYASILADSRASTLLLSAALWPVVAPALSGQSHLRQVIISDCDDQQWAQTFAPLDSLSGDPLPRGVTLHRLAALLAAAPAAAEQTPAVAAQGDEVAFWLYSSGSTGLPKGVRHVHSSLRATADTFAAQVIGIRPDDRVYSAAKLFFAYGLGNGLTFPQSVGATAVLYSGRPTPEAVFDILDRQSPTLFCGVPTLFAALLAHQDARGGQPVQRLRLCTSAGEALPQDVGERWQRLTGVSIVDGVGSTEMLHIFLSNAPGNIVYGTSGIAVPGYRLRLVDEQGHEVADGEIGELLVDGPSAADGYWNRRDKSRSTFEGRWTRTGDKYERTAEGRFVYCGRTDDMFKVSGIWVSPFEIEQALVAWPAILEAAVVARRDEEGLEKPQAFVVLKPGQQLGDGEALKAFVKERIGMWKYPRWVDVVAELPKTATGKIQRFKLRESQA